MGFIAKLGSWFNSGSDASPAVKHAFSVIEEALGPQLLDLPNGREALQPAVENALDYFDATIGAIPGPIDVAATLHDSDPRVQSLFPTAEEIGFGLGRSMALRDALGWFVDHGHEVVHGVMGMRLRAPDGGGRPVLADHTFRSLGIHDQDTRECLREAAFVSLVKGFANDLRERQREWRLLHTEKKIHAELDHRDGAGDDGGTGLREVIDLHLARAGDEFTLGKMQDALIEWLGAPERQLRIEAGDTAALVPAVVAGESPYHLPQLITVDRRKWLICTVRFPLLEAVNAVAAESRPHRYILV